eukprot:5871040-Amphidinium_carterae.1
MPSLWQPRLLRALQELSFFQPLRLLPGSCALLAPLAPPPELSAAPAELLAAAPPELAAAPPELA